MSLKKAGVVKYFDSNTTLVKVKFIIRISKKCYGYYSNTTLVKVKSDDIVIVKSLDRYSNTTLVKVK